MPQIAARGTFCGTLALQESRKLVVKYETGIMAVLDTMGLDKRGSPPEQPMEARAAWADSCLQRAISGAARQQATLRELRERQQVERESSAHKVGGIARHGCVARMVKSYPPHGAPSMDLDSGWR